MVGFAAGPCRLSHSGQSQALNMGSVRWCQVPPQGLIFKPVGQEFLISAPITSTNIYEAVGPRELVLYTGSWNVIFFFNQENCYL